MDADAQLWTAMDEDVETAAVDAIILTTAVLAAVDEGKELEPENLFAKEEMQVYLLGQLERVQHSSVFEIHETPSERAGVSPGVMAHELSTFPEWVLANRSSEISMKQLSEEEKEEFAASDEKEWNTIVNTGAVEVLSPTEGAAIRRNNPERIITSRMVRRWKPAEGTGARPIAKSRWCVHGYKDPDANGLEVFSPTPQTSSIMFFLQLACSLCFSLQVGDVKNAFCQSNSLSRPKGEIFVEPCGGLNLPVGALIRLLVNVYGLNDAPLAWRRTVISFLRSIGFEKCVLEPCWWVRRRGTEVVQMILLEVDDFLIASCSQQDATWLERQLRSRFQFGKYKAIESEGADFAGRRIRVHPDKITVDQEKYILEELEQIKVSRGRMLNSEIACNEEEFEALRSLVYKLNWVGRECRPEAAGVASIIASNLRSPTIKDIQLVNKLVRYLRGSASDAITLWSIPMAEFTLVTLSDAGGIGGAPSVERLEEDGMPSDVTQGAWMILATNGSLAQGDSAPTSILSWRSSKLRRRVSSTLAGETLALSAAIAEVEWFQSLLRDVMFGDLISSREQGGHPATFITLLREPDHLARRVSQLHVVDAKSCYDALQKEGSSSARDRRTAVELAIVAETLARHQGKVRWVPHGRMPVDPLTKADINASNAALTQLLRSGHMSLRAEGLELALRREGEASKSRSKKASREMLANPSRSYLLSVRAFQ